MSYYFVFPHQFFAKTLVEQTHSKFLSSNFGGAIAPCSRLPHPMLGNLCLLAIESDFMDDISNNDVVDYFATNKPKKIALALF